MAKTNLIPVIAAIRVGSFNAGERFGLEKEDAERLIADGSVYAVDKDGKPIVPKPPKEKAAEDGDVLRAGVTAAQVKSAMADMTDEEVEALYVAEGEGRNRSSILSVIEAEILKRNENGNGGDQ
jgi:hypothetical protein